MQFTPHALTRARARGISLNAVALVRAYGRRYRIKGGLAYLLGRREVIRYRHRINLDPFQGIVVICDPADTTVITLYRNRNLDNLPKLRSRKFRRCRRR